MNQSCCRKPDFLRLAIGALVFLLFGLTAATGKVLVRFDHSQLDIKRLDKVIYTRHRQWTLYSEADLEHADIVLHYNSFSTIRDLKVIVYDGNGSELKSYQKSDFSDYSAAKGFEVLDSRLLHLRPMAGQFPYTIELNYEIRYKHSLYFPEFRPAEPGVSVEEASFSVTCPVEYQLRYKSYLLPDPVREVDEDVKRLRWAIKHFYGDEKAEFFQPDEQHNFPKLILAPSEFEMDGRKGNLKNWAGLGEWCHSLYAGRTDLPSGVNTELQDLVSGTLTKEEKVTKIYRWMQNRTRYVSVQLGLGGFEPKKAAEVHKAGYGDCKALVNYTQAALLAVGIESHPALILSDRQKRIDTSFPSQSFNHVILNVPLEQDTLWLECTSQQIPPNYLGSSTAGKKALLLKKGAYRLVTTPDEFKNHWEYNSTSEVELLTGKSANVRLHCSQSGKAAEVMSFLVRSTDREKKDLFEDRFLNAQARIDTFNLQVAPDFLSSYITSSFEALAFYSEVLDNVILSPAVCKNYMPELPEDEDRQHNIEIEFSLVQNDTVHIKLPPGYQVEHLPPGADSTGRFGSFKITYSLEEKKITWISNLNLHKGTYPAEDYEALRDFLAAMQRTREQKILLVEMQE